MPRDIGMRFNMSDDSTLSQVALNATTSILVKAAGDDFIFWSITNNSNRDIWLKLQAASVDNTKKGILIPSGGGYWEMPTSNIFTDEISAMSDQGTGKVVDITEY